MAFCSNCGNEIAEGVKFCTSCGTSISEDSGQVKPAPPKPSGTEYTPEGRKIIKGGPKPTYSQYTAPQQRTQVRPKKEKSGLMGCLAISLVVIAGLIVGGALLFNYASDWFGIMKDQLGETTTELVEKIETDGEAVPENELAEEIKEESVTTIKKVKLKEDKSIKAAANKLEDVFKKADINGLKELMTETTLETYKDALDEIAPYLPEYAKAFQNRKLVRSSPVYALYEFNDEKGNVFTVEFASFEKGDWKLVRF